MPINPPNSTVVKGLNTGIVLNNFKTLYLYLKKAKNLTPKITDQ